MDKICPLLTFDPKEPEPCIEHRCAFYTCVQGTHPQSGKIVDEFGCAIAWMPVLLIENSQQQRQTGNAVESFRNLMNGHFVDLVEMAKEAKQARLEDHNDG